MEGLGQPSNKSCVFRNNEPNLMTFYDDQQITEDVVEFPPGTELVRIISLVRHTTKVVFIPLDYGRAPSSMPVSGPSPSVLITNVSFLLFPLYPPRAPQKDFSLRRYREIRLHRLCPSPMQPRRLDRNETGLLRPQPRKRLRP